MTRASAFFAVLIAVAVLMLFSVVDFGKLPSIPGTRADCGAPVEEATHG